MSNDNDTESVLSPSPEICSERESKRMRIPSINSEFPPEILQVIFSKLPIANLPFCRLVCTTWNRLVSHLKLLRNTFFISTQSPSHGSRLTMHSMNFNPKRKRIDFFASFRLQSCITTPASCNGLLCINNHYRNCAAILNPMTNECLQLPGTLDSCENCSFTLYLTEFYRYGFGFNPVTNQYKIARVSRPIKLENNSSVEILTLGMSNQEWTHICMMPFLILSHGVYFNGALYWVGEDEQSDNVIYRFDLQDNKFEPVFVSETKMEIGAFNGGLYGTVRHQRGRQFEVWMMRSCGGKDSWIREFVVDNIPEFWLFQARELKIQLIQVCEDGQILCLLYAAYFILYDPKTGGIKKLNRVDRGKIKRILVAHQIHSLNFNSLQNIFAGDG